MKQYPNIRLSLLCGMCCLLTVACATAPVQEMSDARQAVAAARDAGAAQRTPAQLHAAELSLQQAQEQLQHYRYREARKRANLAKAQAVQAQRESMAQQRHEQQRAAQVAIAETRLIMRDPIVGTALWHDTEQHLKRAEAALQAGDAAQAKYQAGAAREHALVTLNKAYLEKARTLIEDARMRRNLNATQRATLKKAQTALQNNNGKQAYELISTLF